MSEIDTDGLQQLRSWIGRHEAASEVITPELVQKFRATFNLPDPAPARSNIAPEMIHYCLAQPVAATGSLGKDGHAPKGAFLPPVPLPVRMWAASRLSFYDNLRVGDHVHRTSRIADVVIKEGRSGLLCFVTVDHRLEVLAKTVIEETQSIVYRQPTHEQHTEAPPPAPEGDRRQLMEVSSPLLFRYSALTFNSHRIHYDRDYATKVERYPGLVCHGPLQATLLLHYATALMGAAPVKFSFRSQAPVFDSDVVYLHAADEQGKMKLWTARENGPVATSAEAVWA